MKKGREYYHYLANKLIERFEINCFPNQLAEMLDNWNWRWEQDKLSKQQSAVSQK